MTKKDALTIALSALTAETYPNPHYNDIDTHIRKDIPTAEIKEIIEKMITQLDAKNTRSPEAREKTAATAKAKTAAARAQVVNMVAPIVRDVLSHSLQGMTAKDIYADAASRLPADFTANKVQNILIREMAPELIKVEVKGKPNTYKLASVTE